MRGDRVREVRMSRVHHAEVAPHDSSLLVEKRKFSVTITNWNHTSQKHCSKQYQHAQYTLTENSVSNFKHKEKEWGKYRGSFLQIRIKQITRGEQRKTRDYM